MITEPATFVGFPKMPRLSREVIVTEKIDGTNAQVYIEHVTEDQATDPTVIACYQSGEGWRTLRVGSRTRWLTAQTDNHGFHAWACRYSVDLFQLGDGRHFGEWWGSGIQRGYGLQKGEKRFSLFNVGRWMDTHALDRHKLCLEKQEWAPTCCHVVPVLWRGSFEEAMMYAVKGQLQVLKTTGSVASPGFLKPEGIVVFHVAGNLGFKKTIDKDESPKSL